MLDEEHKLFLKKKEKFENGLQRDQERIQSEQQVQSKYELIKQQYVRLNEQKVKVHQLSDYYDQILKLNENKSDLQEDYTVVEKQVDHEKMQISSFLLSRCNKEKKNCILENKQVFLHYN